jgi:hypothetical protein
MTNCCGFGACTGVDPSAFWAAAEDVDALSCPQPALIDKVTHAATAAVRAAHFK